jgi:endonuclease I
MKHFYTLLACLIFGSTIAQIPSGYYDTATGTGYTLKTQLYNIIKNDNPQGYDAIDAFFASYELDYYYSDTNATSTIIDIYSENPIGADPYNFFPNQDECGSYSGEGDCFNKEHIVPQSVYGSVEPMRGDAHILFPTDGRVNGFRSNYPFGEADDSALVSQSGISNPTQNGSKLGDNENTGFSAGYTGVVFEPIDEFKGDIARSIFYFVTRYENQVASWSTFDMFDGTSDKVLDDPFLAILLNWHQNDPVSQKEIDRNNNIYYNHQSNRNPFVDHPEWVTAIWSGTADTENPTAPTNLVADNPTINSMDLSWTAATDNVGVTSYDVYVDGSFDSNTGSNATSYTVTGLAADTNYCFTIYAKDAAGNTSTVSNQDCNSTLASGTSDCAFEDFENIPAPSTSYATRTWSGSGGTWTATEARTDLTVNGKAITVNYRIGEDNSLTSPNISGGIGSLTVSTQRKFSGSNDTLDVLVNGSVVGSIPYSDSVQTTTISDINIDGTIQITIKDNNSSDNRVAIDDLSWTCYSNLSNDDFSLETVKFYPNPVNGNRLFFETSQNLTVQIFDILGKRIHQQSVSAESNSVNIAPLSKGVYLIKLDNGKQSITKKLIRQ